MLETLPTCKLTSLLDTTIASSLMQTTMETAAEQIPPIFHHQLLNYKERSLRLVHILTDLSQDGLIQCTITHGTVDDEYTCLSYRWGPPESTQRVVINGQPFPVRQNLFDFLSMKRVLEEPCPTYWIDALCIDQANLVERTHQVAQMGDIYSKAQCVHVWLGANKALVPALRILQDPDSSSPADWAVVQSHKTDLEDLICNNEYWDRAWIIQEIFMANSVLVWVDSVALQFQYLHWTVFFFNLSWRHSPIANFKLFTTAHPGAESRLLDFRSAKALYHGARLLDLLHHFRDKRCEVPRDQIFSLLAMCGDGSKIAVDYKCSDLEVALNVLHNAGRSLCACAPLIVSQSLGLPDKYSIGGSQDRDQDLYLGIKLSELRFLGDPPRLEMLVVDGKQYAVRQLDLWRSLNASEHANGRKVSRCALLRETLYALTPRFYQVTQLEVLDFDSLRLADLQLSMFKGHIIPPADQNLFSLLRDGAPLWIEEVPELSDTYCLAHAQNLDQKMGKPLVLRLQLKSFADADTKALSEYCFGKLTDE